MNRLFTTYYAERRPERRRELDLCLALNATAFDRVCVMSEGVTGPTQGTSIGESSGSARPTR
jgi:hypothetical protein